MCKVALYCLHRNESEHLMAKKDLVEDAEEYCSICGNCLDDGNRSRCDDEMCEDCEDEINEGDEHDI